jgi:hypothetical protein
LILNGSFFVAINFIPAVLGVTTWPTTSWTVSISTFDLQLFFIRHYMLIEPKIICLGFFFICSDITMYCFMHQLAFELFLLFVSGSVHNQALVQVSTV